MKQESAKKPPCFNSEREYEQWQSLLMRSREKGVTICDDCTNDYRKKMKAQSRCKPAQAKRVIVYRMVRNDKMYQNSTEG